MDADFIKAEIKTNAQAHINRMWRAMVSGFMQVDSNLSVKWGAHLPSGYLGRKAYCPGLCMYCENYGLSILVEYGEEEETYTIGVTRNNNPGTIITTVNSEEEIAPAIISYMATQEEVSKQEEGNLPNA